ncbi:hypothetical protein ABKN59_002421 [Abortiporus biennis]
MKIIQYTLYFPRSFMVLGSQAVYPYKTTNHIPRKLSFYYAVNSSPSSMHGPLTMPLPVSIWPPFEWPSCFKLRHTLQRIFLEFQRLTRTIFLTQCKQGFHPTFVLITQMCSIFKNYQLNLWAQYPMTESSEVWATYVIENITESKSTVKEPTVVSQVIHAIFQYYKTYLRDLELIYDSNDHTEEIYLRRCNCIPSMLVAMSFARKLWDENREFFEDPRYPGHPPTDVNTAAVFLGIFGFAEHLTLPGGCTIKSRRFEGMISGLINMKATEIIKMSWRVSSALKNIRITEENFDMNNMFSEDEILELPFLEMLPS